METRKVSKSLLTALSTVGTGEPVPVIVRYRRDRLETKAVPKGIEPQYQYRLVPAAAMRISSDQVEWLSADASVEHLWLDLPVKALLDMSVPLIGVPKVWEAGPTGKGMRIAIVDTGADPQHPDLVGRIAASAAFTGRSFVDDNGHGTHVAGIAAGSGSASGGKYRGVAPEASLYIAKVLGRDGSGMTSDVMAGIEWAVDQRVHVIGLSLGGAAPCDGTDALSTTCDAAVERGVVVCAAAGNEGPGRYTVGSPGCARLVITVGAGDDEDHIASFSSRGPTSDGRVKPDVVFPGVDIVAPRAASTAMGRVVDEYYTQASGTSMATPHAVGAVALLLQANPALTPAQVKQVLMATAKDLGEADNTQGAGRAEVYAAFQSEPGDTPTLPPPVEENPGCLGQMLKVFKRQ